MNIKDYKVCSKCKVKKDRSEFYLRSKNSKTIKPECKICSLRIGKEWAIKNKEYRLNYSKTYESTRRKRPANHVNYKRENLLKRAYRLTKETYDQMLSSQNNKCKICQEVNTNILCVDHCHASGKVRGLLCRKCNLLLGHAQDSIEILNTAINYLKESKE